MIAVLFLNLTKVLNNVDLLQHHCISL